MDGGLVLVMTREGVTFGPCARTRIMRTGASHPQFFTFVVDDHGCATEPRPEPDEGVIPEYKPAAVVDAVLR